jgi:hypothetical protein
MKRVSAKIVFLTTNSREESAKLKDVSNTQETSVKGVQKSMNLSKENVNSRTALTGSTTNVSHANQDLDSRPAFV